MNWKKTAKFNKKLTTFVENIKYIDFRNNLENIIKCDNKEISEEDSLVVKQIKELIEIKVPDIGDYKDVPVIEVLVKVGDKVEKEQSIVVLESDKATMDAHRAAQEALVASTIGIDAATIKTRLAAGETLAAIAGAKKDALIAALVAFETKEIDARVTAGTLTAAQATAKKADLTAHVTAAINAVGGKGMGPKGGMGKGPRH